MKFQSKYKNFHSWKCIWKYRLRKGGHFVQGEMTQQGWVGAMIVASAMPTRGHDPSKVSESQDQSATLAVIINYTELLSDKCNIFLAATKQLYEWYFPSVCPSVCHTFLAATKQLYEWYFLSVCPSVRSDETPLLWLVFGTVGNYVAISDYVADHTKQFQTISWNVSTCHMCLIS